MVYMARQDDIKLDMEKVKTAVDAYSHSTGVHCIVIDVNGKTLYETDGKDMSCKFCSRIQNITSHHISCSNVHRYGSYQAERFGGKYVFFCPVGMVHWTSPIFVDGSLNGAILGGPVLMIEPEEFLMDELLLKNNIDENHIDELREYINDLPIIRPDMVESLSEMLFMVASHLSDINSRQLAENHDYHEQQADISEYIHSIKAQNEEDSKIPTYPIEKERELISLISIGNKAGAQKVLNEIFGYIFFSTGGNFDIIKARVLELIVLLSRAAMEGGADVEQIFGLNYRYLSEINSFQNVDELTFWLSRIMVRFTDCVFNLTDVKHVDVIYKAVNFIKQNYMRKLTLEDVASHVYLSPSYFSKVFKSEMKCNFTTYLNQVRIDMSKKLLLDDTVPLVDIANLVGYEDQSYFTKVFKKNSGISPGKYRESRGTVSKSSLQLSKSV